MSRPLVSVVIPAYRPRFFREAFESALRQSYPALEVIVCDDSPGGEIEAAVGAAADARVRYERHVPRLGFHGNFTRGFELARGEFVKFLNDDDRLRPDCVAALVGGFEFDPRVTFATSRRAVIDAEGRRQPDMAPTLPLAHVSCLVPGRELADFVLVNSMNFIGEPSTVLLRKRDVAMEPGGIFRWGGLDYHVLADLSLWLRLLARGAAFYQAPVLSEHRQHDGQEQRGDAMDVASVVERLHLLRQARSAGFLGDPALYRAAMARVAARGVDVMRRRAWQDPARAELQQAIDAAKLA